MKWKSAAVGVLFGLGATAQLVPRQSTEDLSPLCVFFSHRIFELIYFIILVRYVPSPGSPGFYANHSSAAVTIDQHSVLLDGKRFMIFRWESGTSIIQG